MERKPLKAPQETPESFEFPLMASMKMDGIRCIVKNGQILSATMRPHPNIQLRTLLRPLLEATEYVFDGELYSHYIPFTEISGIVRRQDAPIPNSLGFHCFDILSIDEWNGEKTTPFSERTSQLHEIIGSFTFWFQIYIVSQHIIRSPEELSSKLDIAEKTNYEGLMLRDPNGLYKHGRATLKEGIIFKCKFWDHYDARIVSVCEMMGIREGIEREKDPTGRTKPVHKIGDKEPKGTFGYFIVEVDIPGNPHMQIGGWKGLTHEKRKEIWDNRDEYIGRWIRFESMAVGQKDVPRIPKNIEFRDDK